MSLIFSILLCTAIGSVIGEFRRIDETVGKFVVDVTSTLFSPSSITTLFCLDDGDGFQFARQMSRSNVMQDLRRSIDGFDPEIFASRTVDHKNFFVLDLDCPGALNILIKASQSGMFVAPAQWLILQDLRNVQGSNKTRNLGNFVDDVTWIHENLGDLKMFPDSKVILGQRVDDDEFRVLSPYRPSPQRGLILEDRGHWTRDEGLVLRNLLPESRRRQNLHQTELKSCLVITNPETHDHLEDYQNKHQDAVTKANYPWVRHLVRRMNATVNFTWRDSWGYKEKNGSWSGMMGMLERREIDLGGTATFLIPERLDVVNYVQLYTPTGSKFLFRRPPLSYVSNLFTLPFGRSVWIASGIFLVFVIGLLWLAMKWEFKMKQLEGPTDQSPYYSIDEEPSLSNNLLVIIGAVSQQGSAYEPRAVPTRIIVLMLLLATLSLYASYTANIVALLQSTASSINTPRDIMNSPLKVGVYDIIYSRVFFELFSDPERKEFYETKVKGKKGVWMGLEEGIRRVRNGLFAFHVEYGAGYQLIQETFEEGEKCGIHEIDYLKMLNPLLIVQLNSPYLEIFRVGGLWIHETGLQHREISRLYTDKPVCHGHNSFVSVGITECHAALMTLAYGLGATFGVLLLEIFWHTWTTSRSKVESPGEPIEPIDLVE